MVRRIAGVGMMVVEALLLWRTMGYLPIAILTILVALFGCWPRLQRTWALRKKVIAATVIFLIYLIWWWLDLQHLEPSRSAQFGNNMSLAAALGLMMIQAIHYYGRHPVGLSYTYPFFGILALTFAADNYLNDGKEHTIAYCLIMGFGLLMGVFYAVDEQGQRSGIRTHRRYKGAILGLCFLLSFALAGGTAWVVGKSDRVVGHWLADHNFIKQELVLGNQQRARLNSTADFKGVNAEAIALQIVAEKSPGYLRGQVYGVYEENAWQALPTGGVPSPVAVGPVGFTGHWRDTLLFPVRRDAAILVDELLIYPDAAIDRALFAPLESGWAGLAHGAVSVNQAGVLESKRPLQGQAYQLLTTTAAAPVPLTTEELHTYLSLPRVFEYRLKTLAESVCVDRSSTLGKTAAIVQYFTTNYDYSLGIEIPDGQDPLTYFLFSHSFPDAHCEYFATGTALLLRAVGVPTRYVTGVGVWEEHPYGDYWIARNRDAHAWVEAWDEEQGWFIVEATPAGGLPQEGMNTADSSPIGDFWGMLKLSLRRMIGAIRGGAWLRVVDIVRATFLGLINFMVSWWWICLLLISVLAGLWTLYWYFRRRRTAVTGNIERSKLRMHAQLSAMDHWVDKRYRVSREAHRTVHHFAEALEGADLPADEGSRVAQWYRQWASIRYRSQLDEAAVAASQASMERLRHSIRGKGPKSSASR